MTSQLFFIVTSKHFTPLAFYTCFYVVFNCKIFYLHWWWVAINSKIWHGVKVGPGPQDPGFPESLKVGPQCC